MKKLLILGAGVYQVPLIKKAKEMGLYTIVASYHGSYPGLTLADEVWEVDTRDTKVLLSLSQKAKIAGVCTAGTDVAVRSLGILCERLGLFGLSAKTAKIVTNKALMKETFLSGQVTTPPAYKVYTYHEALQAFEKIGKTALIKAVDSSGSRGIIKIPSADKIKSAWATALGISQTDYLLVEEFIKAEEIGVDGFICNGNIQFMLTHDKFTHTIQGVTLPTGHAFPRLASPPYDDPQLEADILHQIERAIMATGLNNCAFNADVLITDKQAYIIEIGGRSGATCIPELISIYGGFDYYEQMILNALGEIPCFTFQTPIPCMAKLLFSTVDGAITAIDEALLESLRSDTIHISLDYMVGEKVTAIENGTSRIGQVIMNTSSESELDNLMSKVRHAIQINGECLDNLWDK